MEEVQEKLTEVYNQLSVDIGKAVFSQELNRTSLKNLTEDLKNVCTVLQENSVVAEVSKEEDLKKYYEEMLKKISEEKSVLERELMDIYARSYENGTPNRPTMRRNQSAAFGLEKRKSIDIERSTYMFSPVDNKKIMFNTPKGGSNVSLGTPVANSDEKNNWKDKVDQMKSRKAALEEEIEREAALFEKKKAENKKLSADLERATKLNQIINTQIGFLEKFSTLEHNKYVYCQHKISTSEKILEEYKERKKNLQDQLESVHKERQKKEEEYNDKIATLEYNLEKLKQKKKQKQPNDELELLTEEGVEGLRAELSPFQSHVLIFREGEEEVLYKCKVKNTSPRKESENVHMNFEHEFRFERPPKTAELNRSGIKPNRSFLIGEDLPQNESRMPTERREETQERKAIINAEFIPIPAKKESLITEPDSNPDKNLLCNRDGKCNIM